MTKEIRVNMKNILTVPWKKRQAADGDSVGSIVCCTVIVTEREYGRARGCSLLQIKVKVLVLAGYIKIRTRVGKTNPFLNTVWSSKWFTIHKFKLNSEVLEMFAFIFWFLKKLPKQTNKHPCNHN